MIIPPRLILKGVPRVGFFHGGDRAPESVPFPSCLAAAVRYIGDDWPWLTLESGGRTWRLNYANIHFLCTSGMAFGLRWKEGWQPDNVDHMFVGNPNRIIDRAMSAAGHRYTLISRSGDPDGTGDPGDEDRFRQAIVESLRRRAPVLAFGVVGPPECALITGYDEGGRVLMGWSFFQEMAPFNAGVEFEPTGEFRKPDWFADTHSLLVIGDGVGRSDDLESTLRHAISTARQPAGLWGEATGLKAYGAWARQLADDSAFVDQPEAVLRERHEVHHSEVGVLAECRAWAAAFCRHQAGLHPEAADALVAAAERYQAEHGLMWQVWDAAGGIENGLAWQTFARPEVRRALIPLIEEAREHDEAAVRHLEEAAERLQG